MPDQNVPYLVGNSYKRDHFPGLTMLKADFEAAHPSHELPNGLFPMTFTRKEMAILVWQVKRWRFHGNGVMDLSGTPTSFSVDTELLHSTSDGYPLVGATKKTYLIQDVIDLQRMAGSNFYPDWEGKVPGGGTGTVEYHHNPFLFNSSNLNHQVHPDQYSTYFLWPKDLDVVFPFPFQEIYVLTGINTLGNVTNALFHVFDPVTKLFWPQFECSVGGTTTNHTSGGPPGGEITMKATGRMPDKIIPLWDHSGAGAGQSSHIIMEAIEYW